MNDSDSSAQNGLTRRELLGLLGAGALAALLPAGLPGQAHAANNADFDTAKGPGLIFVVGDGMPAGVVRAMHEVRTGVFGRANTALHSRLRDPRSALGLMATASLSSIVTDSAPASAAWSTGVHPANRPHAALPDGRPLTTIFELVRKRGVATGLVTTTRVTHATPAAWISHQTNRDLEDDIASEILAFRPDVLLGGGFRHFSAAKRKDGRDLLAEFQRSGCDTVTDRAGLLAATAAAKPLVGLFSASHLAYPLDRLNAPALSAPPTLPERPPRPCGVGQESKRFLLQVERAASTTPATPTTPVLHHGQVELDDTLAVIDFFLARTPRRSSSSPPTTAIGLGHQRHRIVLQHATPPCGATARARPPSRPHQTA
jgi:alkaline phosphatase